MGTAMASCVPIVKIMPLSCEPLCSPSFTNLTIPCTIPPSDKLVKLVPPAGLRFNGHGYSAFDTTGYSFSDRFSLQLRFKTFSEEGLLFFVSDNQRDFLSIEMIGGGIVFQVLTSSARSVRAVAVRIAEN